MKKNNLLFYILTLSVLTAIISCSNQPTDEKLKQLILDHEKTELSGIGKNDLNLPCGRTKALEIPKIFRHNSDLLNAAQQTSWEIQQAGQHSILDNLALAGIINMNKTKDETFTNTMNRMVSVKEYTISLTEKGDSILVGQDGDKFVLSLIDLKSIKIVEKKNISNDTLKVKYLRTFTPVFQVLHKFCQNETKNNLPTDTGHVVLTYKDKEWKFLAF